MKKYWKRALLRFDRSFSNKGMWKPFLWVVAFCVAWTLALWLIGLAWGDTLSVNSGNKETSRIDDVISLMMGSSNYPLESGMPHWYQFLIAFVGTVFFTAFLISTLSSVLTNRSANHRKGFLRYWFSGHVLILGGSKVAVGILKSIAADEQLRKKEVVILSNRDAEELWVHIVPLLTEEERKVKLTIYHGERNMKEELKKSQVALASVIYIIGEDDENEHDSINVDSWKFVRALRDEESRTIAQCYMLLERNASTYVFNALPREDTQMMETTILNRLESVAQQVLIGDDERWKEYTLDRGAVVADSDQYVHLVVIGMTQMGYAMATTAAHLCHYPNFDANHRTKISFIDPNAEEEMKMFKGRYPGLFELSHSCYRENGVKKEEKSPLSVYGDFLDVEWEFVKGSVVDDWVRKLLMNWREDERQILTLAFCGEKAERNMAEALYLPSGFFRHVDEKCPLTAKDSLIWVYQPENSALVDTAHEVSRYKNLLTFGTMTGSFDSRMGKRLAAAKRINYLYQKQYKKEVYGTMANQEELDRLWHGLSYAEKMSNIYAANSIYCKFRSMGIDPKNAMSPFADGDTVTMLAMIEHARWNIEKLLVGYSALPIDERDKIKQGLESKDSEVKKRMKDVGDTYKKLDFLHKDITPYDDLIEDSKLYDKAIVRNLADVIKNL